MTSVIKKGAATPKTNRDSESNQSNFERMEKDMKKLTTIKTNEDVSKITVSKIQNMELQNPGVVVTMEDGQAFLFPIMTSFQVHRLNEFLRSLNLGMEIWFGGDGAADTISNYEFLVESCMNELRIQRIMDSLELPDGLTPDEVYFIMLGRLSTRHKLNLIAAKVDYLEAYVHEAVQIIRKERVTA